jgi:hypothetical protein
VIADCADVGFFPIEEPENSLVGGHEDRAHEPQVVALAAELDNGRPRSPDGDVESSLVDPRPIALDQVASPSPFFGHLTDSELPAAPRNRVFPYLCAGKDPIFASCPPNSARERTPSLR